MLFSNLNTQEKALILIPINSMIDSNTAEILHPASSKWTKMRSLSRNCDLIFIFLIICLSCSCIEARYGGGTGEPNDPFLIYTPEHMDAVGRDPNDWGYHFKLMADIDLSIYGNGQFHGDGMEDKSFTGTFDGNGHRILNLAITSTGDNVGLFTRASGIIMDLGLVNPEVQGNNSVGALVGSGYDLEIRRCYVTGGSISGMDRIGGLVGYNGGHIIECYTRTSVSGTSFIGGLAGYNEIKLEDCYSHSDVSGQTAVGGLVGGFEGVIMRCYSCGAVNGQTDTGGLIGVDAGDPNGLPYGAFFSYWDKQTTGQATSADGQGRSTAEMMDARTFMAWSRTGLWTLDQGRDYPHLAWEQTSGQPISGELSDYLSGVGTQDDPYQIKQAEELNLIGLFPWEWDKHFKLMDDVDMNDYTCDAFTSIGYDFFYPKFPSSSLMIIGSEVFTGIFDGNGKRIYNFTHSNPRRAGLFNLVGEPAVIKNVVLIDPNVNSEYGIAGTLAAGIMGGALVENCLVENGSVTVNSGAAGGLIGSSGGDLVNCCFSGSVLGYQRVGGLVASSYGVIEQCYSIAQVRGYCCVGGLTGRLSSSRDAPNYIHDCYSCGCVIGISQVGGLVGLQQGPDKYSPIVPDIARCYSTAVVTGEDQVGGLIGARQDDEVSDDLSSFWDVETSSQLESAGGVGKTTAEMKQQATFTDWDFIEVWDIEENQTYPFLRMHNDDPNSGF